MHERLRTYQFIKRYKPINMGIVVTEPYAYGPDLRTAAFDEYWTSKPHEWSEIWSIHRYLCRRRDREEA